MLLYCAVILQHTLFAVSKYAASINVCCVSIHVCVALDMLAYSIRITQVGSGMQSCQLQCASIFSVLSLIIMIFIILWCLFVT